MLDQAIVLGALALTLIVVVVSSLIIAFLEKKRNEPDAVDVRKRQQ